MNRPTTLFGTALLAAMVIALAAIAGGVTATAGPAAAPQVAANDTTANATAPGAQLAGVVGVQQTEVDSDLDNRTFGLRVANADSDAERAAIIAERQNSTQAQLASQSDRLATLREARANGTISNAEYRARVATVAAQAADTERDAAQLNRTASQLPEEVRERNNINVTAIDRLQADARTLGGPETAEIARSISGTTARNPMAGGSRGPPMGTPGAEQATPGGSGPVGERGGRADRGPAGQGPANTSEQAQTPGEAGRDRNATPAEPSERRGGGNSENTGGEPNDDNDDAGREGSSDTARNSGNSDTAAGNQNRP
ncbi:hypothetical protein HKK80_06145 [Halonotius sp. F2-221B]|uniref:hypothetical protein n=1 Tax=Halonotius sp. F2-221B TaxID=2731620 RepID=UPI00398AA61D